MIILVIKSCRKPDTAFKLNILRIGIDEKKPDKLFYYVKYVIFYMATGIPIILYPNAQNRFSLIFFIVLLLN